MPPSPQTKYPAQQEQALMTEIWDPRLADDLTKFVLFTYPWGKKGTPLETFKGPRKWQIKAMDETSQHIKDQREAVRMGKKPVLYQEATCSGRGPGKSALVSWEEHWMMSTRLGSTTIITANTEMQLKTRTFAEIGKWLTLAINAHWFEATVLAVRPAGWFEKLLKEQLQIDTGYYYAQGQLWSEENPDAFAGVHNPLGVQVLFDEASGIPQPIFNVTEGFFTEPVVDRYWRIYSNGRRNSGAFFDVFNDPMAQNRWHLNHIDSRTVEGTDQDLFDKMIAQHGIDSDVVRVEILGLFPKQGLRQFIDNDLVWGAQRREVTEDPYAALIMGVDVARYGDDSSVIRFRQGRDARSIPAIHIKNRDNVFVAREVAAAIDKYNPDAVNIDSGAGTGVIDVLRDMKYRVNEIFFGGKADSHQWANKRTEMYAQARDWLGGGALDASPGLFRDLISPEYDFFGKAKDQLMLESKESMKSRGLPSPDDGDAFVLTFAAKVARRDRRVSSRGRRTRVARDVDYPVFG